MDSVIIFLMLKLILLLALTINGSGSLNVPNLNQNSVKQVVYQKFQTEGNFQLRTISPIFVKVPG